MSVTVPVVSNQPNRKGFGGRKSLLAFAGTMSGSEESRDGLAVASLEGPMYIGHKSLDPEKAKEIEHQWQSYL
ncbi:hypothetical protein, partial [Sphingobium sp.]|uniref:hypothetical protein n=1 Tax=Sphingobium sp. TaxID=1912891 RepID=UPI0025CF9650